MLHGLLLLAKVLVWGLFKVPPILAVAIFNKVVGLTKFFILSAWDFVLFLGNVVQPGFKKGTLVQPGVPGYKGLWGDYVAPLETDSRSPCPGLNAMANQGVLPHDGRKIKIDELCRLLNVCFNFSETLCAATAASVKKQYGRDWIDLSNLAGHNVTEHDASFIRHDAYFAPDQVPIAKDLIDKFVASASGPVTADHPRGSLTAADISRWASLRLAQSKRDNPVFSMTFAHKLFAVDNGSIVAEVFGGDVAMCQKIFTEERFPDGWESSILTRHGLTIMDFHLRSAEIALGMTQMNL